MIAEKRSFYFFCFFLLLLSIPALQVPAATAV